MASIALNLTEPAKRFDVGRRILQAGNTKVYDHDMFEGAPPMDHVRWLRDQIRADPEESTYLLEQRVLDLLGDLGMVSDADAGVVGEALAIAHASRPETVAWIAQHPASAEGIVIALSSGLVHAYEIRALLVATGTEALAAAGAGETTLQRVHALTGARDQRTDDGPRASTAG